MVLVGRDVVVAELADRLGRHRLVTVTGPGGIGKTALAAAVADQEAHRFALGAQLVDLTRIDSAAGAGAAGALLAAQLGFPSFPALVASPGDQPALLVVDNCEHVLDDVAAAIAALLDACPSATILATSRSPLDLPGESIVVVGPLALPPVGALDPEAPPVRLFLERARDAGANIGHDELEAVTELCRTLDGIPLAIELAAARARVLTPAELAARLQRSELDTLSRTRFRGPGRHRSLRETIEWSYQLLDPSDQRYFERLSVLAGPFTAGEAEAVAAMPAGLDHLDRLVADSLLTTGRSGGETLYRQLELLRAFARERLIARGEWEPTWLRFVDHNVRWSVDFALSALDRWDAGTLTRLLSRFDSHLAALRWCVEHDREPLRSFTLVATLWGVVHQGHLDEVAPLAEAALARWPDPGSPGWPDAAATVATCRYLAGAPEAAVALAHQALTHAESSLYAPCTLRRVVGHALCALGDLEGAVAALDDALDHAGGAVAALAMEIRVTRALLAASAAAPAATSDELATSLGVVRAVRSEAGTSSALNAVWAHTVEAALLARTDRDQARAVATEALAGSRAAHYPACESVNLHTLAVLEIEGGDTASAAGHLLGLLDGLVARGAEGELRNALRATAVLFHRERRAGWADLSATIATMPVVSVFEVPGHERLSLPGGEGRPQSRRDAVTAARQGLLALVGPSSLPAPATGGTGAPGDGDRTVAGDPVAAPGRGRFVASGDVWEVVWAGRAVSVRHSKGMTDLAASWPPAGTRSTAWTSQEPGWTSPPPARCSTPPPAVATSSGSASSRPTSRAPRPTTTSPGPSGLSTSWTPWSNTSPQPLVWPARPDGQAAQPSGPGRR